MLYNLLLSLLILDGLILTTVVLLQAGQGGGLASMGGGTTDLVMGGRQAVTILHKASWICGGVFMFLALLLAIVASNGAVGNSAVQERLRQQPTQQTVPTAPLQTTTAPAPTTTTPPPAPVPPPAKKP
jgi:preprotein translocase subunit SecG